MIRRPLPALRLITLLLLIGCGRSAMPKGPAEHVAVAGEDGQTGQILAVSVVYRWPPFPGFGPPVGVLPSPVPAPGP